MRTDVLYSRHGSLSIVFAVLVSACQGAPDSQTEPGGSSTVVAWDGVPIAYDVNGADSTALVLVHGWSCDRTYWAAQVEALVSDYRVVTVDLGGHGESGLGREAWTIESFGRDVAAVADRLDLQEMILVGHSMGGDVILEAARHLSGRVKGLVWVDTYSQLGSPRTVEQIEGILAPFRTDFRGTTEALVRGMFPAGADPGLVDRVATDMAAAPPAVAVEALRSSFMYGRQVTAPLMELNLPVVAINPEGPANDPESMARHGVDVVLMSDAGHFMMMEDPVRFTDLLRSVISRWSSK